MNSHSEIAAWYNKKYSSSGDETRRSVDAFGQVLKLIPEHASSLLDIGCGRGEWLEYLHHIGITDLAAVDLSDEAVEYVSQQIPGADIRISPGEKLPFKDRRFNFVTCLGVLEHMLDIPAGLAEMNRVLKSGGLAIIMVPNKRFIGWLFKNEEERGTQQREISETLYSVQDWQILIEDAGFEIEKKIADRGFIFNNRDLNKKGLRYLLKRALFIFLPFIPVSRTYQVIFVTRSTEKK